MENYSMFEIIMLSIGFGTLIFMSIGAFIQRKIEKNRWNNGKCTCGGNWYCFDTDSQGGRGYNCDDCDKSMWISWGVDK